MALTKVSGKVAYPYGTGGVMAPVTGSILYTRIGGGAQDGAVTIGATERADVHRGVAEVAELGVGAWTVTITPADRRNVFKVPGFLVIDGTLEAIDLASYVPVVEVDGKPLAKGDAGASAYEVAVANGFVGTEAEWLASLAGTGGGPVVVASDGDGTYTLTRDGTALEVTSDGDGTYQIGA